MAQLVYIGDSSTDRAGALEAALSERDIEVRPFTSMSALAAQTEKVVPDLVLLAAEMLAGRDAMPERLTRLPALAYGTSLPLKRQLALYKLGVRRVISEETGLETSVATLVEKTLHRRLVLRAGRQQALTSGAVQAFSLPDVLQNVLRERKNLILKIHHPRWDLKFRTFQGHVVNAFSPHLANEDALIKAMMLNAGTFTIRGYQKLEEVSPMPTSTLGLLAEATFQRRRVDHFLQKRCQGLANPAFAVNERRDRAELSDIDRDILDRAADLPVFQDLMLAAPYPLAETLEALERLMGAGYLVLGGEGTPSDILQAEDVDLIREWLFPEKWQHGNLAVVGSPTSGRSELIQTLAGSRKAPIKSVQSFDFTRIQLDADLRLTVLGLPVDETFLPALERVAQGLIGCIFLVDARQPDQYEFHNYLFTRLVQLYRVPFVVGLSHAGEDPAGALADFRKHFQLPDAIQAVPVNPDSFGGVRELIANMGVIPQGDEAEVRR